MDLDPPRNILVNGEPESTDAASEEIFVVEALVQISGLDIRGAGGRGSVSFPRLGRKPLV